MKKNSPTIRQPVENPRGGAVLVLFGFALFVLFGFAALAVDLGQLYQVRAHLQVTASAAAAAALDLPNGPAAATAVQFARLNMPSADHGEVQRVRHRSRTLG